MLLAVIIVGDLWWMLVDCVQWKDFLVSSERHAQQDSFGRRHCQTRVSFMVWQYLDISWFLSKN